MVSRVIWVLMMVLVGYGSNDNMLRVCKKVDSLFSHSDCKHFHQRPLPETHQFPEPEQ